MTRLILRAQKECDSAELTTTEIALICGAFQPAPSGVRAQGVDNVTRILSRLAAMPKEVAQAP